MPPHGAKRQINAILSETNKIGSIVMTDISDRELLRRIREGEREAKNHPRPEILHTYSFTPDQLADSVIKSAESHLAECSRCQTGVEDNRSKKDFFSRQETMRGDCDR